MPCEALPVFVIIISFFLTKFCDSQSIADDKVKADAGKPGRTKISPKAILSDEYTRPVSVGKYYTYITDFTWITHLQYAD